jgi:ABC-type sugar transport system ATPase subunit
MVALQIRNVSKSFGENKVLSDINMDVRKGEVHALIGENGAGKSTLVKIIGGIYSRDAGEILIDGEAVDFKDPLQAMRMGISIVHQELSLVPNATVAENIYLRREITNRLGFNDWSKINQQAAEVFQRINLDVDSTELVGMLSVGMQQLVEVAKAIALNARIVIMDEPTSSLSENEIPDLFRVIRSLRDQGISIIFISHKLTELFEISDRITVLRDGEYVGTVDTAASSSDEIIRMMVGRHLGDLFPQHASQIGDVVFECRGLSLFGRAKDVNFKIRRGEILGLSGLVGAGRTEAMRALVNADLRSSGQFWMNGEEITIENPQDAIGKGIYYVSEDRKSSGLFLSSSITWNVAMASLDRMKKSLGMLDQSKMHDTAEGFIKTMDVRPADQRVHTGNLSGGNQQKVLLSMALCTGPRLLIVDEPTRGVDIGAKSLIHKRLREIAEQGACVIVISSEMPEIIGMSDRILVFRTGHVSAELDNLRGSVTQEEIMQKATHN